VTTATMTGAVPAITVERLLFDRVDAATLAELAHLKRQEDPLVKARQSLTPEGVDRLAEIIGGGSIPTVGFFRRFRAN